MRFEIVLVVKSLMSQVGYYLKKGRNVGYHAVHPPSTITLGGNATRGPRHECAAKFTMDVSFDPGRALTAATKG